MNYVLSIEKLNKHKLNNPSHQIFTTSHYSIGPLDYKYIQMFPLLMHVRKEILEREQKERESMQLREQEREKEKQSKQRLKRLKRD